MLIAFVQPILIDPLFNNFEPLDASHPELVGSIEKLLDRAGLDIPREPLRANISETLPVVVINEQGEEEKN